MSFSRIQALFFVFSIVGIVVLLGGTYLLHGGFARSLSFDGGIRISLRLPPGMTKPDLRTGVTQAGFQGAIIRLTDPRSNQWDIELGPQVRDRLSLQLQKSDKERQQRVKALRAQGSLIPSELQESPSVSSEIERKLLEALKLPTENILASEAIAASYGANLTSIALRTLIYTVIAIGLYLSFRFDFPFAIGSSVALIHDLLFTVGFIGIAQIEPSIPVIAAVLTILGYSINDTIVIFDRIRENTEDRSQTIINATIDLSITQTLPRTIVTSILTLMAVFALLIGGERSLRDFGIVLLFGVSIGTYSSIFIAAPCVQYYERFRNWIRR